ncbi:MAG: DUF489 family protein [Cardiobacteriaceae bacterium]|nr:DUF489 family protein [Cardiobacteriaceae bacterium]
MDEKRQQQLRALSALSVITFHLHQLATEDESNANGLIQSLLPSIEQFGAKRFEEYYPHAQGLNEGRERLLKVLEHAPDMHHFRLFPLIVRLEKQLSKKPPLLQKLRAGLDRVRYQQEALGLDYPSKRSLLSALYRDTITERLGAIKIYGRVDLLQREERVQQIRVLLLLGLRASALWRQAGGGVFRDFVWSRKRLIADLKTIDFEDFEVPIDLGEDS